MPKNTSRGVITQVARSGIGVTWTHSGAASGDCRLARRSCWCRASNMTIVDTSSSDEFHGARAMSNEQGLVWHRLPLGSGSVGAPHTVPWFVLSIKSEKERTGTMLYVLHSRCCFDFGPTRALGWLAGYCGIRPRARNLDDKLRGNHGKDSRTDGASTYRSP